LYVPGRGLITEARGLRTHGEVEPSGEEVGAAWNRAKKWI
jgi:hypothetical protein